MFNGINAQKAMAPSGLLNLYQALHRGKVEPLVRCSTIEQIGRHPIPLPFPFIRTVAGCPIAYSSNNFFPSQESLPQASQIIEGIGLEGSVDTYSIPPKRRKPMYSNVETLLVLRFMAEGGGRRRMSLDSARLLLRARPYRHRGSE